MTTFVALAIADGMFPETALTKRRQLSLNEAKELIDRGVVSCCNPSHKLTLEALGAKYGIFVPIPDNAPFVSLKEGDEVIVLSARFPRRLNEGEVWSAKDVEQATFSFGLWEVIAT